MNKEKEEAQMWFNKKGSESQNGKDQDYVRLSTEERLSIIEKACKQVSRGVFYSTIIIIASFLPVFMLTVPLQLRIQNYLLQVEQLLVI